MPPSVRIPLLLTLPGCLTAITGCNMIPPYQRPGAPVASAFPGGNGNGNGSGSSKPAADVAWTQFFQDGALKKLIAMALAHNRDLRIALLKVARSRAQYRIEQAGYFPRVNADDSFNRQKSNGEDGRTTSRWSASIGASSYELDLFGRVGSLNAQALEQFLAAEEGRRAAQISLISQVATQYCTIRQAAEQTDLARRTLAAVEQSYNLNKITSDAGATSELDLKTAEAQVQTARINILTNERQVAQAENALVLLVGVEVPADLMKNNALGSRSYFAEISAGIPSELLLRRPDILEAEHALKAANANIGAARAAFFPSISLTGSAGSNSNELSKLFGSNTAVWSFSPQINVPIFEGGANLANLDAAKVGARIEVANYEKVIQTAFREVADALVARSSYRQQIDAQEALEKVQQRRYDLANERYLTGEELYLTVLSAQRDLYSAQQNVIKVRFDNLTNDITLYKALGGGLK